MLPGGELTTEVQYKHNDAPKIIDEEVWAKTVNDVAYGRAMIFLIEQRDRYLGFRCHQ